MFLSGRFMESLWLRCAGVSAHVRVAQCPIPPGWAMNDLQVSVFLHLAASASQFNED